MKLLKQIIILLSVLMVAGPHPASAQSIPVIPVPLKVTPGVGQFSLTGGITVSKNSDSNEVNGVMNYFISHVEPATGFNITRGAGNGTVQLLINNRVNSALGSEGYTLDVTPGGIAIRANTAAGLFYGVQTLLQLLPPGIESSKPMNGIVWSIPAVSILDVPRFPWRGIMFDASRHFFPKEYIKTYIDRMARYKFNRFHWHLTDDEGWRIEIKSLPKLTDIGAWRVPRDGAYGNARPPESGEKATDGGFYTQDDIREVIQYAKERFIEILPEIDVPGHSMAAVAAYPELCVTQNPSITVNPGSSFATWYGDGTFKMHIDNTLNPANEQVYTFLDKVFTEVAELFPFPYIHTGGDECYHGYWEEDPGVKAFMSKNALKTGHDLQSYFNRRINTIIASKKKKVIGWDEILEGGLAPGTAVMSWRGIKGGLEASKQKHSVVMSPAPIYYLDMLQGDPAVEEPIYNKARLKNVYEFDILAPGIDSTYVLGGQGNLWTEHITTAGKAEYMTYPRALAIAETLWSARSRKEWTGFLSRIENQFSRFELAGVNYAGSLYDPIITVKQAKDGKLTVQCDTEVRGLSLYYSLDNSIPDKYSDVYHEPIQLSPEVANFRVQSYRDGKPIGRLITITREDLIKRSSR